MLGSAPLGEILAISNGVLNNTDANDVATANANLFIGGSFNL